MSRIDLGDVAGTAEEELADVELILAVGGKVVLHEHPATGAQGQAIDVLGLILAARDPILAAAGLRCDASDRLAADVAGGRDVLIQERRGDAQDRRDVVKAVARDILRQERPDVHVESQQRVDLAPVLGSIEAMHTDVSGRRP